MFTGIVVVFAAAAFAGDSSSTSTGVVIFIGPIPFVFESGPETGLLILVGVLMTAISIVLVVIIRRKITTRLQTNKLIRECKE